MTSGETGFSSSPVELETEEPASVAFNSTFKSLFDLSKSSSSSSSFSLASKIVFNSGGVGVSAFCGGVVSGSLSLSLAEFFSDSEVSFSSVESNCSLGA